MAGRADTGDPFSDDEDEREVAPDEDELVAEKEILNEDVPDVWLYSIMEQRYWSF